MKHIIDTIVFFASMVGLIVAIMAADAGMENRNQIKQLEQTPAVSCEDEPECWDDLDTIERQWAPVSEDILIQIGPDMRTNPTYRRRA
jgi:hypothetical protein